MKILVINGPNLNMLGIREPGIYGKNTFADLLRLLDETASAEGLEVEQYQSNHEGDLVDKIQWAYGKVDGIYWMVINAFGVAITTFVGQNFGARLYERMKKSINVCLGIAAGVTLLLSGVLMVVAEPLLGLFSDDAQVLEIGLSIVRLIVPTYITYIFIEILSGAMRGAGDSLIPTIMTLTGVCLLRVFWVTVVVSAHHELNVLLLSYPITWIVTSSMFMVYYLRGRWLKRCIALQNAGN